jgi:hypothetical protein
MIDTLKLAKRMREAQMPQAQAEALAAGLAEALREGYVTREDLETQLARLRGALTGRLVGVAALGAVLNHVWK